MEVLILIVVGVIAFYIIRWNVLSNAADRSIDRKYNKAMEEYSDDMRKNAQIMSGETLEESGFTPKQEALIEKVLTDDLTPTQRDTVKRLGIDKLIKGEEVDEVEVAKKRAEREHRRTEGYDGLRKHWKEMDIKKAERELRDKTPEGRRENILEDLKELNQVLEDEYTSQSIKPKLIKRIDELTKELKELEDTI